MPSDPKQCLAEATCYIELARRAKDYGTLAEAAKSNSDAVNFLAGLIARG